MLINKKNTTIYLREKYNGIIMHTFIVIYIYFILYTQFKYIIAENIHMIRYKNIFLNQLDLKGCYLSIWI